MGACAMWLSERTMFLLVAVLAVAAQYPLRMIAGPDGHRSLERHRHMRERSETPLSPLVLLSDHRLVTFAACVFLFQVSSAAIVPLAVADLATQRIAAGGLVIAAFVIIPQLLVACCAPAWGGWPSCLVGAHRCCWASQRCRCARFCSPRCVIPSHW